MKQAILHAADEEAGLAGRCRVIGRDKVSGEILSDTGWMENRIMKGSNTGVNLVAQSIAGIVGALSPTVTHGKIGTGTTTPADADTDLTTPTNLVSTGTPVIVRGDQSVGSTNVAHMEFFVSDADLPNGTYTEWGLFVGTFGVDEHIFAHTLLSPTYTKATNQDTTIIHEITVNN